MKFPEHNLAGRRWRDSEGRTHRFSGPAFEWDDGTKDWYLNGLKIVRQNGDNHWTYNYEWMMNSCHVGPANLSSVEGYEEKT